MMVDDKNRKNTNYLNSFFIIYLFTAWQVIGQGLRNATKSLHIYVYQVTAPQFCDAIETAHKNGLFVKVCIFLKFYFQN